MADSPHDQTHDLLGRLRGVERSLASGADEFGAGAVVDLRSTLALVEERTPGGAPLHSQLDNVRKWLDALERPADHERFGGAAHLRGYVLTQLRLALGALEDYQRTMS